MQGLFVVVYFLIASLHLSVLPAAAQVMGDDAELTRLRLKGEEAIANDDPDGAAMTMGRAALLAAQVAKKQTGPSALMTKANEALFRSQEHTYRAMALFRRAGGQLPASSGVCGSLALAFDSVRQAGKPLADPSVSSSSAVDGATGRPPAVRGRLDHGRGIHDRGISMSLVRPSSLIFLRINDV